MKAPGLKKELTDAGFCKIEVHVGVKKGLFYTSGREHGIGMPMCLAAAVSFRLQDASVHLIEPKIPFR